MLIQRAQVAPFLHSRDAHRRGNRAARGGAAPVGGAARSHSASAAGQRSRRAVRGAAADARRSDAAAARGVDHRGAARERRVGAAAGVRSSRRRSSTRSKIPTCASGRAIWPTWSVALRMNLTPGGSGFRDVLRRVRGAVRARGRRAAALDCGAARLEQVSGVHHRRRQPHLSHGHSRALAPRPGGRRAARCDRENHARHADPRRWRGRDGVDRSAAGPGPVAGVGLQRYAQVDGPPEGGHHDGSARRAASRRPTACRFESRRTSICSATRRLRERRAPKASGCSGPSCCSPDVRQTS